MRSPKDDCLKAIADKLIYSILHGCQPTVWAKSIMPDGRRRKPLWEQLITDGYLRDPAMGDNLAATATATEKVLDEIPDVADFKLEDKYQYDSWDDRKLGGSAWVFWDWLSHAEQATVIRSARSDPSSYTFHVFHSHDWKKRVDFRLGEGSAALDAIGRWDACVTVSNAAVRAKRDAGDRALKKETLLRTALTDFLRERGAIRDDDKVPLKGEGLPLFDGVTRLSNKPQEWPTDLPDTIRETKAQIEKSIERLRVLQVVERHVENSGGWEAFLADYDAAVEKALDEHYAKKEASRGQP